MASVQIVTWRDIPAVVEARDESGVVSRQLSERFPALIDAVAMQLGLAGSDEYLEHWKRTDAEPRPGSATDVADAVAGELEERFTEFVARAFARS